MSRRIFIFAGGGTGGHVFPALAVAGTLRERLGGDLETAFICSDRPLDARILEAEGVRYVTLKARPFSLRPRGLVRFARSWGRCVRESRALLRRFREEAPEAALHVVAMGGFVAPPVVQAARVERFPVTLINLDAVPGKANRWVARRAGAVLTAARVDAPFASGWAQIGPIVRPSALATGSPQECRARLGLDPARPVLLVSGGSQGARTINLFILETARRLPDALSGWQILHQTGEGEAEAVSATYEGLGIPAVVMPFVSQMGDWWGAADLAVARSGAGTVGEAWANRVPCLFLPYPFHRDEHQRHNAAALAAAGGAIVARDLIEPEANVSEWGETLRTLLGDPSRTARMRAALEKLGKADGAGEAADHLLARR